MVAPYTDLSGKRKVYLPEGEWYSFFTGEKYGGGCFDCENEKLPVFVKKNTLLALAKPQNYVNDKTTFELELIVYGECGESTIYDKTNGEMKIYYKKGQLTYSENFNHSLYQIKEIRVVN